MSKVICDVCGTTYPETASQCPICGCAKPESAKAVSGDGSGGDAGYTYVKGGRFSKSNVRKRNKEGKSSREMPREQPWEEEDDVQQGTEQSNRGLVIALVLLLVAIAAVLAYIIFNFFGMPSEPSKQTDPSSTTASDTTGSDTTGSDTTGPDDSTEDTGNAEIPCTDIVITEDSADLKVGDYWNISATATPENTTDPLTYESSDPAIATVSDQGKVTVLAAGEVTITVRCGSISKTIQVVCVEDKPVVPDNADDWSLNREDITFSREGESWKLFRGTTSLVLITFTSDDEDIVTFKDGIATAVGEGTTNIHAEYNGRKFSCIIRCDFTPAGGTTDGTDTPPVDSATVQISHTDVTVRVGESFNLTLKDAAGTPVVVTWKAAKEGICTITNNKITGASVGNTIISTEYEGQTYACIVYVKAS